MYVECSGDGRVNVLPSPAGKLKALCRSDGRVKEVPCECQVNAGSALDNRVKATWSHQQKGEFSLLHCGEVSSLSYMMEEGR